MKKKLLCLLLALCMLFAALPVNAGAAGSVTVTLGGTRAYDYSQSVLTILNQERSAAGAGTLTMNATLTELAMQRAAEIAVSYSHTRPDGSHFSTIMDGVYTGYTSRGENIAIGYGTPEKIMQAFMASADHKANILKTSFTQVGLGCYITGGTCYWVQLFGNSPTNTAVTTQSGRVAATAKVQMDPSHLHLRNFPGFLQLSKTETCSFTLSYWTDTAFLTLMPTQLSDVRDASGKVIATLSADNAGNITVHPVTPGTGTVTLPVYAGQSGAPTLEVTVKDTYKLTVTTTSGSGTVTVDKTSASINDTITVTAIPDEGYFVSNVSIHYSNGQSKHYFNSVTPIEYRGFMGWDCDAEIQVSFGQVSAGLPPEICDHLVKVVVGYKEATCLTEGYTGDTVCPNCGTVFQTGRTVAKLPMVNPFTDVHTTDYYYDSVMWAYHSGITAGTTATTFDPNGDCTRAQVVTFLWRAAGKPSPTSTACNFVDMLSSDYYYDAVLWAVEKGITVGTTPTTFGPGETCTRAQVATFLWRTAGEPSSSAPNPFRDVSESQYYCGAVLWAVENEITQGDGSGSTFNPDGECTRAQIVTFLYRYLN